jgi:nucleoside-diphosphate-sugar epimerase
MSDTGVLMESAAVKPGGRLLVLGGGYSGLRFGRAAAQRGFEVLLTSRQERPQDAALRWLVFDSERSDGGETTQLQGITHVLMTAGPRRQGDDPMLPQLAAMLQRQPLQWVGYLSTTGVYGCSGGAWVDETTPPRPRPGRSQWRLEAERAWQATGLPVQVFRLPAIYGPWRCPFEGLRQGTSKLVHKPGQVFSRVHVDDIVGSLLHCIALPEDRRPAVVNVCDDCPCPSSETLGFAAHLLGLRLPDAVRFAEIETSLSPMARSFWGENRRASNHLLCQQLGYRLRYPSYREGFRASLAEEERNRAEGGTGAQSGTPGSAT